MPSERRFLDDGTKATRFDKQNDGDNRMNENEEDVAHGRHRIKFSKKIPEFRLILDSPPTALRMFWIPSVVSKRS
jgi:hypothetical protein